MSLKNGIIQGLKKIVGESNVLTDAEDLYVYSFEQFFTKRRSPRPDAVIRATDKERTDDILEFARKERLHVFRRGGAEDCHAFQGKLGPIILIDDIPTTQLSTSVKTEGKRLFEASDEEQIESSGYGTIRSLALALKSFLSSLPSQRCLDCKVCSGYCTVVSSFNGVETWSSKGRTILTKALMNNELQPSRKLIDVIHTCSLCGLCFADCFENTQVRKAIMEARHRLAEAGRTSDLFAATAKNIFDVGDPSGMPPAKRIAWTEHLTQKDLSKKADVLYWAGCVVSTRTPQSAKALANLLTDAEVDYAFLGKKEGCCGYVLLAAGLWIEAKENALRLIERVRDSRAETLVTPCAGCYYTFTKLYPEILDVELPCEILHATQYLERLIQEGRISLHGLNWEVTYHDPCSLGRHSNIYEPPRNVLKAVPELTFVEMPLNRSRSRCCGAGGGLWSFNNTVAMNSATEKLEKDVIPLGVSGLVTACPTCHINFRYTSVKKAMGIKIYDITEVVEAAASTPS